MAARHYHDDDDVDHEFEARIRDYFGLERQEASPGRGTYGRYEGTTVGGGGAPSAAADATSPGDVEDRDLVGHETPRDREDLGGTTGTMDATPVEGRTTRRDVDEPLEPREETGDVPLEQPVVIFRVRRVHIME